MLRNIQSPAPGVYVATSDQPLTLSATGKSVISPVDALGLLSNTRSLNMVVSMVTPVAQPEPSPPVADDTVAELTMPSIISRPGPHTSILAQLESIVSVASFIIRVR